MFIFKDSAISFSYSLNRIKNVKEGIAFHISSSSRYNKWRNIILINYNRVWKKMIQERNMTSQYIKVILKEINFH